MVYSLSALPGGASGLLSEFCCSHMMGGGIFPSTGEGRYWCSAVGKKNIPCFGACRDRIPVSVVFSWTPVRHKNNKSPLPSMARLGSGVFSLVYLTAMSFLWPEAIS